MTDNNAFVLRVNGQRKDRALQPDTVDVAELAELLLATRKLIAGEGRREVYVPLIIQEGSILLQYVEDQSLVDDLAEELQAYWNRVAGGISQRRIRALEELVQFVKKTGDRISLSGPQNLSIELDAYTVLPVTDTVWVDAEVYLTGKVLNIGGKSTSNIHLDTTDDRFNTLIIDVPREVLANQDRNRVYQTQTVRITIKQNLQDGSFDRKSARLLAFVDDRITDRAAQSSYLDSLIGRATANSSVEHDAEAWLRKIRGYEA